MLEKLKVKQIENFKHIHFIGIGGVSMSGIAEIVHYFGFSITGSDTNESDNVRCLKEKGIPISIGHNVSFVAKADLVVYTAAIRPNDPELVEAQKLHIPTIERAEFLGYITKAYQDTICISGTHGKTTTTSMVSLCFLEANLKPTIQVGANLKQISGNFCIGESEYFIIEACEYVESFLHFFPHAEVVLNIDNDHLDYFKNMENIENAFIKFVKRLPNNGYLVINGDDTRCLSLSKHTTAQVSTFGLENPSTDFVAKEITFDENGFAEFDVFHHGNYYHHFKLSVPGRHNVYNALACIALCSFYPILKEDIENALLKFTGANRRFEYIGNYNQASIYDDYAHHPTEIEATAKALKQKKHRESWAIFQSHTYSRTANLLDDFIKALLDFDHIIVTDIYAAREENIYNISPQHLVNKLRSVGKDAIYIRSFDQIADYVKNHVYPKDIVLTVGAGPVVEVAHKIVEN